MIPTGGITAAGNTGEINTSARCDEAVRCREMKVWPNRKMPLVSPSPTRFPVATFTSLP